MTSATTSLAASTAGLIATVLARPLTYVGLPGHGSVGITTMLRWLVHVLLLAFATTLQSLPADGAVRTIDVRLSRYAFSPERIELRVGERARLNLISADRAHGFQVKKLGVDAYVPAGGSVTIEVTPADAGTFEIRCSEYCGTGHRQMKAWLIVSPRGSPQTTGGR